MLRYVGASIPGEPAVRFGIGNGDMSAGRLFSLRIDARAALAGGIGVRARDATNASTIQDISIAGFPDGQLLLDATPAGAGSGPNFVRVDDISLTGGVHPLRVEGGRQTVLVGHGRIELDATSQEGIDLDGGEELAATRTIESISVTGNQDVPGFRVRGRAVTAFVGSSRSAAAPLAAPGFLYTAMLPLAVTECLDCLVRGPATAFAMPQLGVDVRPPAGRRFASLNPETAAQATSAPFALDPPQIRGTPAVGQSLTSVAGTWMNEPSSYGYQWIRCKRVDVASNPATRCTRIAGATAPAYVVTGADAGVYLRVSVTATNASGARPATSLPVLAG